MSKLNLARPLAQIKAAMGISSTTEVVAEIAAEATAEATEVLAEITEQVTAEATEVVAEIAEQVTAEATEVLAEIAAEVTTETGIIETAVEMISMPVAEAAQLRMAADAWTANAAEFKVLKDWHSNMAKAGAGLKQDNVDDKTEPSKLSKTSQRAKAEYERRKARK
jgi:hypothetical protein